MSVFIKHIILNTKQCNELLDAIKFMVKGNIKVTVHIMFKLSASHSILSHNFKFSYAKMASYQPGLAS